MVVVQSILSAEREDFMSTISLWALNKVITEFVFIKNGEVSSFKNNLDYFK